MVWGASIQRQHVLWPPTSVIRDTHCLETHKENVRVMEAGMEVFHNAQVIVNVQCYIVCL